jgi:hypothetical protein
VSNARKFLENVLVWPGSAQAPGWINVHVNAKNTDPNKNGGKSWVVGWPFKTIDDVVSRVGWIETTTDFFNVWVCMSQQSHAEPKPNGRLKAVRKAANATLLKSIWIDCDVKANDPKHYGTLQDAWAAIRAFQQKVGLPTPSVLVNSGGGLHVYWTSDKPLTPDEWRPYAEGLKQLLLNEGVLCDTGLTTDIARILRVPDTLNHKYDPPRKVELLHCGAPYDFAATMGLLRGVVASTGPVESVDPTFDAPDAAFAGLKPDDALQAGATFGSHLVDPIPIFGSKGCGFLREALLTGGKDYDNPQWNLSVLCTAFMEGGDAIAHKISQGHATYTAADTQALYDRKVADRADRGIGYPSCAAIAGAGCKHCQTCPHFSKGKSPLNIRPLSQAAVTATVSAAKLLLPEDYDINAAGRICFIEKTVKKDSIIEEWKPLFHNIIDDARASKSPEALHLHITTDKGNWTWAQIRKVDFAGPGYEKKLAEAGLDYVARNKTKLEDFFMSFLAKMKAAAEQQTSVGFGWYRPKGPIEGFAYAGNIIGTDGQKTPAAAKDENLRMRYEPTGTTADWHTAASYILRQRRPDFDTIIATAFAAPLMEFTGSNGGIIASMGDAGSGKSYAMEVAAAVWSNHKQTVERKGTTDKSLIHKLGALGHLPAYWDEISDAASQARFMTVATQISGGGEGGRLTQSIKQQDRGEWSTIININGNKSWRDYVLAQQKDHGAGLRRVLEYWVPKTVPNPQGQVPPNEADAARALLLHNYGYVGEEYATYLITHLDQVQQILQRNTGILDNKLVVDKSENMWLAMCATLLTGAEIANLMPTPVGFNTNRLFDFLMNVFIDNRRYMKANVTPVIAAEDYLAQYLKDRFDETIWTQGTPAKPGRPSGVQFDRLRPNATTSHGVSVRWDRQSMTLKFSKTNFEGWCDREEHRDASVIARSLEKTYGMKKDRLMLASGTPFKVPQELVYIIDVTPYPDLRMIMDSFVQETQTQLNSDLGTPSGVLGATGTGGV